MPDSPSAILSRAADLIRDTAAAATEGPWAPGPVWLDENDAAVHDLCQLDSLGAHVGEIDNMLDCAWIALMSPAVAPMIEAWLRYAAEMWDYPDQPGNDEQALDFARAVLGEKEETDGR